MEYENLFKWLKSLRLHKYHSVFENLTFEEVSSQFLKEVLFDWSEVVSHPVHYIMGLIFMDFMVLKNVSIPRWCGNLKGR